MAVQTKTETTPDKLLADFFKVFRGCRDKYVIHQLPYETTDAGKTKFSKVYYALKNPNYKKDGEDKAYAPVTIDDYRAHLNGEKGVAIEPLTVATNKKGGVINNACFYSVIDIDSYGKPGQFLHLIRRLYELGFKFAPCISKSKGLHLYFMFRKAEQASRAIDVMKKIISVFGLDYLYVDKNGKSKVEYFPMHTNEVPGENGKCVFLPYFNAGKKALNSFITPEGKPMGIAAALDLIKANYTSVEEIETTIKNLPYSDAPFCIQMIALTGLLGANGGRNDFLFHASVYLRRKFGKDNFWNELLELDRCLESPLQDEDYQGLQSTYESANNRDWNYSCTKSPQCNYCNKIECKKRQYSGTVKDNARENENTGADMMGPISRVMARTPYYIWEIAAPGKEPKDVKFNDVTEIYNQSTVQQKCLDQLGWAPLPIKPALWIQKLNDCMEGIEERQIAISAENDTSELSELNNLVMNYLTHRQIQNGAAYMIQVGQVFRKDDYFYFSTDGIKEFLRVEHYNLGRTNLREELMRFGCEEGEVEYETKAGVKKVIKCWKKKSDLELEEKLQFYDEVYAEDAERAATIELAKEKINGKQINDLDEDRF